MSESRVPAQLFHLADLIQEEMAERGWTITDLVMNMGPHFTQDEWAKTQLSWELFIAVRDPNVILGERMANQLGDAFDVNPKLFTNYHEMWRAHQPTSTHLQMNKETA